MDSRIPANIIHQWSRQLIRLYPKAFGKPLAIIQPLQRRLFVSINLLLYHSYPISTSRYGLSNINHSFGTPTGVHYVSEKIGDNEPLYTQFIGRQSTQKQIPPNTFTKQGGEDAICTRILRLSGLEPLINSKGCFDSYRRLIYIHGTPDEKRIPLPTSIGCIRMKNNDVMELFDILKIGSLVYIAG